LKLPPLAAPVYFRDHCADLPPHYKRHWPWTQPSVSAWHRANDRFRWS